MTDNYIANIKELLTNQDLDKCEIYEQIFGETVAYDTARKQLRGIQNFIDLIEDNSSLRALQSERIKLQTEKSEYLQYLREQSRADLTEEKIVAAIRSAYKNYAPPRIIPTPHRDSDLSMVVGISDMHYGAEFAITDLVGAVMNEYSPEICEERMWVLADEIVEYANKNKINEVTIFNLGDGIEGILHVSQLMTLRYGIIDSTVYLASFLLKWVLTLANQGLKINYKQVRDNHSDARILTGKKGDFPHENCAKIISWHIDEVVKMFNVPNITVQNYNAEGNIYCNVGGFDILAVHGHNESKNLVKSLQDYIFLYNKNNIDYLFAGHLHYGSEEDATLGKEVVRFPAIMGGNDFSIKNKKISNAGAKILLLENGVGITDEHRVIF